MWECCEKTASETYPSGREGEIRAVGLASFRFSPLLLSKLHPIPVTRLVGARKTSSPALQYQINWQTWHKIINNYSRCALTKAGDKLIAVAGIAKQMSRILNDDYVVGMWRRHLELELSWMVEYDSQWEKRQGSRHPNQYRCPSFSWASVDGIVKWQAYHRDLPPIAEVTSIDLQFLTNDTFGIVTGGSLLLRGQLHSLTFLDHPKPWRNESYVLVVDGTEMYKPDVDGFEPMDPDVYLDEHPNYFDPVAADPMSLYCIPLLHTMHNELVSLLLQLVDASQGTFRRIGLTKTNEPYFKEGMESTHDDAQHLPCISYDGNSHIIRII